MAKDVLMETEDLEVAVSLGDEFVRIIVPAGTELRYPIGYNVSTRPEWVTVQGGW